MSYVLLYLVVTLLGQEAALSDDQIESSTGHQQAMTHVTKHHRKQEGESNDGVWSCNRWHTGGNHHTTRLKITSRTPPHGCWNLWQTTEFEAWRNWILTSFLHPVQGRKNKEHKHMESTFITVHIAIIIINQCGTKSYDRNYRKLPKCVSEIVE